MRARSDNDGLIDIRVIPRAGRSGIAGLRDEALLVRLAAAPVDGAANDELIQVLARALDIPKRSIEIVSGERSRSKRVRIAGFSRDQALAALGAADERHR
ncbi:MAG: DUF167 domain-containing protein [Vicinamibacterales bacterium]